MTAPAQNASYGKVPFMEKIGYGLGELGNNLFWQFFMYYLLFFYTDIYKIAPGVKAAAVAGEMFLIVRMFDAVFDVVVGVIADRTHSRWGKYRPYLLFGALPFGLAGVLAFSTPDFDATGKIVYAYVTYTFLMMIYSIVAIPQNSLLGVLSPDSQERITLSKYKFVFAFCAGLIVQFGTPRFVELLGHGDKARGFQHTLIGYAIIAVALFVISFLVIRERVTPPPQQKTNLKQDFKDLSTNLPWIMLSITTLATIMSIAIRSCTFVYYFENYVGGQQVNTIFWGVRKMTGGELMGYFLVLGTLVTIAGTMLVPFFTRLIGKKALYCALIGTSGVVTIAYYFIRPDQIGLIFIGQILYSITLGPTSAVLWAMYADTADYSEWRNNRRATALVFSAAIMAQKFGWTFGGWVPGEMLSAFGYVADTQLSQRTLHGILIMNSIIPAVCAFAAAGLVLLYNLSEAKMKKVQGDLKQRRETTVAA
ncbi:MAG: MFS transporter [Opitutaceae bacterium]|jgi:GPH family glycoside/pentoside/hexuronide:cation symporter